MSKMLECKLELLFEIFLWANASKSMYNYIYIYIYNMHIPMRLKVKLAQGLQDGYLRHVQGEPWHTSCHMTHCVFDI